MVINIEKEIGQNFIDFSYEANSSRAFADARDGLKPGQRACLWEMFNSGYTSKKPPVKSAKISGAVTGNWWPHGNVAIYETFARMSQPWINNIPEVGWHGNNGSRLTGPECASERYTEARLAPIAEEGMFRGIKKNVVNMISNYSEDAEWPEVLPAIFPRLMVNGCQGIGSTIANVWLPHSFTEISNAIINYIDNNTIDYDNLAPDFPTGGIIINKKDLSTIYKTGKGKVILRGRAEIKKDKILITELPYQVYAQPYVEALTEMAIKDEIIGISEISNKSGKKKLLIEITCNEMPEKVLKQLYKKTNLQKSYSANQWALVGKTPMLLTLEDYFKIYIKHNIDCIVREAEFDMKKALDRLHIVEGLLKALEDIDNIIALIKKSASGAVAKEKLIEKYDFTEAQAKAILAMRLSSLANLEKIELQNEKAELNNAIEKLDALINNKSLQTVELKERLSSLVKKFGDARRTELTHIEIKPEEKEIAEVTPEDVVVVATQSGLIKKIPTTSYRVQRRGGKGIKSTDDAILDVIKTNTIDTMMFFTSKGKMYRTVVDNIPTGTNVSKGILISDIVKLGSDEKVIAISSLHRKSTPNYVIFVTKMGMVKKTYLEEYTKTNRNTGIAALNVKDGDEVVEIIFQDEEDMILITEQGMSIKFSTKEINPIGRVAMGVKGIKLADGDSVVAALPVHKLTDQVGIFTRNGIGKKVELKEFPIQARGGKGTIAYKPTDSAGVVVGATMVSDEDNILICGNKTSICISAKEVPQISKQGVGNILLKNNIVSSITKI